MWGMVGETLRDEVHGKMEKVELVVTIAGLSLTC